MEDGELLRAAARAGVEVAQHIAKLCWLVVDQRRAERTAKLSMVVAGCWTSKGCGKWTEVGEDLSTRDDKVNPATRPNL